MPLDELDHCLLDAWDRILARCRADPREARRRWRRTQSATLRRPIRPWCLAIRSSDTRMVAALEGRCDTQAIAGHEPHDLTLTAAVIRQLCAPVWLDRGDTTLVQAAAMLGRHPESLRHWLAVRPGRRREVRQERGVTTWEQRRDPTGRLHVRYTHPHAFGHNGYDVPVVWSDRPFDPNARRSEPPHPIWGSMWQTLAGRIPDDVAITLTRVPHTHKRHGREINGGWYRLCPGRPQGVEGSRDFRGCGRRVRVLYMPLPVFTLNHYCNAAVTLPVTADPADPAAAALGLRLAHDWRPGLEPPCDAPLTFACQRCWRVRNFSLATHDGWNDFVTHLSGGVLYGRDVQRPASIQLQRKRSYRPRPRHMPSASSMARAG